VCVWDGLFKWIKLNLSYSFPLMTPPLWAGIWFSQVLLNWLLRFESESDNARAHTHHLFDFFFLSVFMSKDIWALAVHIWADDHGAAVHVSGLPPPSVINIPPFSCWTLVCLCVCTLAELTMSPVGNFKEWTLQRPIKAAKRTQRVNIWLIPQHSRWELTHTHKFKLIISIPWHAAWKKKPGLRKTKASETNSQFIDG